MDGQPDRQRAAQPERSGWRTRTLVVRSLGSTPYKEGLRIQAAAVRDRREERIPDTILLLEHPHVITLGSTARAEHLLLPRDALKERGIDLFHAGRGGDVTYHGPGQLVGYPILDLKPDRRDLHAYLRSLESVLLRTLAKLGVSGARDDARTGVWVNAEKVAAIGVRVSRGWITSHGFALNVDPDLSYYGAIVPCGIADRPVTTLSRLLKRRATVQEVMPLVVQAMVEEFGYGGVRGAGAS